MVVDHVVCPSQTTFLQGRNITDGVVTLHETIHGLHTKKLNGIILKSDFEKAYYKVKWYFLQQTLKMKDFLDECRALINNFVYRGSVAINSKMSSGDTSRQRKVIDRAIHYHQCYSIW
jgi:hypothetical protein